MTQFTDKAMELVLHYWDLAYAEGKDGRITDTAAGDAQRTFTALRQHLERGEADLEAALQDRVALAAENERLRGELTSLHPGTQTSNQKP